MIQTEKQASGSEEVLPGYAFGYTFDDIGNRTQTVFNERSAAYTSDTLNQYTQCDYSGAVDARDAPRTE